MRSLVLAAVTAVETSSATSSVMRSSNRLVLPGGSAMTRRLIVAIFLLTAFLPHGVAATPPGDGWSEKEARSYLRGCISGYSEKQMEFMFRSGQIPKDATPAQVDEARSVVHEFVTATCECARNKVMADFSFAALSADGLDPAYMKELMSNCASEVLESGGIVKQASSVAAEGKSGAAGDVAFRFGAIMGFGLPILAIIGLAVGVAWLIFRPRKPRRDNHRSGWR